MYKFRDLHSMKILSAHFGPDSSFQKGASCLICFKFFSGVKLPFEAEAAPANLSSAAAHREKAILG